MEEPQLHKNHQGVGASWWICCILAYDVITFLSCHALGIEQIKASSIKYPVDTVALGAFQSFSAALTTPAPVSRMQWLNCFEDKQTLVTFAKVFNLCIGAIGHSLARRSNCIFHGFPSFLPCHDMSSVSNSWGTAPICWHPTPREDCRPLTWRCLPGRSFKTRGVNLELRPFTCEWLIWHQIKIVPHKCCPSWSFRKDWEVDRREWREEVYSKDIG